MPKNTGRGGNKRKKWKKPVQEDRELRFANESEEYAQITKILGDGRFQCKCSDGIERIAHVRGKMRKRVWLANGDIILVSLREFEPEKCDVVEKYKDKELTKLKSNGEIPDSFILPSSNDEKENIEEGDIKFEEEEKVVVKKKEDSNGFEIDSDEENEDDESEEKKENENNEKEKEKEDEEKKEEKEEKVKEKKNKKDKKDKDRKIKNNRDKKRGKKDDDNGFNIDNI